MDTMAIKPEPYNLEKDKIERARIAKFFPGDSHTVSEIVITGPMTFWILMLCISLLLSFLIAPVLGIKTKLGSDALLISQYILYLPGSLILPLIVSLWVGSRIGSSGRQIKVSIKAGILNGVYMAVVYGIAISAIIISIYYINPTALPSGLGLETFAIRSMGIPAVIVIVLTTLISFLSAARHIAR
jgi:hypothetical protein